MSEAPKLTPAGRKKSLLGTVGTLLLVGLVYLASELGWLPQSAAPDSSASGTQEAGVSPNPGTEQPVDSGSAANSGAPVSTLELTPLDRLREAIERREERVWMTLEGQVVHVLADDLEGSRHQRFLFDVASDLPTLKLSHNIDLAPRVPMSKGDTFVVRGRYEWNEHGGVIHWTHHDPDGELAGGWVEFSGERYE